MAILGITAILFIIGIFGWLFISVQKGTELLKEKIKINVKKIIILIKLLKK
jgi:hypothetical protein